MKKDILKRVLCLACCLSLTLGMFAYRPTKAEAVFASPAVAFGASLVASAVVATTAQLFVSTGAAETVGTAIDGLVTEFISAVPEYVDYTTDTFFAAVSDGAALLETGAIQLSAAAGNLTARFINWLQGEKGLFPDGEDVTFGDATGKCYFNGHLLPELGSKTLTYNLIYRGSTGVYFFARSDTAFTVTSSNKLYNSSKYNVFYAYLTSSSWTSHRSSEATTLAAVSELIWTDHDISGCMDAALPIPQTEYTLSPNVEFQTLPNELPDYSSLVVNPAIDALDITDQQGAADSIMAGIAAGTLSPTVAVEAQATDVPGTDTDDDVIVAPGQDAELLDWTKYIGQKVAAIPQAIADAVAGIFVPDAALVNEITGTFSAKFGFVETLKTIGDDLFGMTPSTEPPVVWIHLEDAEGKYTYGGTVKALDMSWYQRYKADMDRILGGFLWLAYLWLLFRRLPDILGGAGLVIADGMYIDTIHGPSGEGFMFRRSKRL